MAALIVRRMCGAPTFQNLGSLQKLNYVRNVPKHHSLVRLYTSESKDAAARAAQRTSLKEKIMQPNTSGAPFKIGASADAVAGATLLGMGALGYYGLGFGKEASIMGNATVWPQYVRDRIKSTYMYFGGSIAITAASTLAAFRSRAIMNLLTTNGGLMGVGIGLAALLCTAVICNFIPYTEPLGAKHLAWVLHTASMGATVATICSIGGPLLIRAALYTAGVVGGLTAVAVCAPSDKFLYTGGPLSMGLGVVLASSVGSMFLNPIPMTALEAGVYLASIYGGLILFSGFLLYDTQRLVVKAERYTTTPEMDGVRPYDPILEYMSIYMDTIMRIATMLDRGGK